MIPRLNLCTQEKMGLAVDTSAPFVLNRLPQDLASSVRRGEHCHMEAPDARICWNRTPPCEGLTAGTREDLTHPSIDDAVLR